MPFVVRKVLFYLRKRCVDAKSIGVLGITFKKNCDDTRNSKNVEMCEAFKAADFEVYWIDPLVPNETLIDGCTRVFNLHDLNQLDGLIYAVDHEVFDKGVIDSLECKCFIDLQDVFPEKAIWSL